jgi:hypothetical protein
MKKEYDFSKLKELKNPYVAGCATRRRDCGTQRRFSELRRGRPVVMTNFNLSAAISARHE